MPRKPRKKKSLQQWLIPKLRKVSLYWPEINEAVKRAKVKVQIGFNKNGTPKYKTKIKCECCDTLMDSLKEIQRDHIVPVVDIDGFTNWDDYINSMFCEASGIRILCKPCHKEITDFQNEGRVDSRRKKKLDK